MTSEYPHGLRDEPVEALGEEPLGVALHRVGGEGDQGAARPFLPHPAHGLDAVHAGKLDVHEHHVAGHAVGHRERLLPAAGQEHRAAESGEDLLHQRAVGGAVVHHQRGLPRQVRDIP